jgi:hypothetical protein
MNLNSQIAHPHVLEQRIDSKGSVWLLGGEECKRTVLPSEDPLVRRYVGFQMIDDDLSDAAVWIERAYRLYDITLVRTAGGFGPSHIGLETVREVRRHAQGLFHASIVSYAKCFLSTEGRKLKLEERDHVPEALRETHGRVMQHRHQLIAHAGVHPDERAHLVRPVLLRVPSTGRVMLENESTRMQLDDDRQLASSYRTLLGEVRSAVAAKLTTAGEVLIAKFSSEAKGE